MDIDKQKVKEVKKTLKNILHNEGIDALIDFCAESLAFQFEMNKINTELYKEISMRLPNIDVGKDK